MQGKEVDGRPINVDMSTYKAPTNNQAKSFDRASKFGDTPSKPSSTLFIGNLPFTAERDGLSEFFSEYGNVQGIRLPTNPETERPRGFGYVEFGDWYSIKRW
ncbi:unnamed protein product [[Candida] boidinii]|nr:unnamed protein product [[Candida] boidinii]